MIHTKSISKMLTAVFTLLYTQSVQAQIPDMIEKSAALPLVQTSWKQWLIDNGVWFAPLSSFLGPVIGLTLVGIFLYAGLKRIAKMQQKHIDHMLQNEKSVKKREKAILASALAAELTENKIKCEAFITIYNELLRNLRDNDQKAQYEEAGDFIHQRPPLSRSVFDANVEKISVFGTKLAGDVAGVYAAVRQDPEYFNLEANMPRPSAIRMVEMILDDAQKTLEPFDPAIAALNIIVRGSSIEK